MAVFYKGRSSRRDQSSDLLIRHIVDGTEGSPYISLAKSYAVAVAYARMGRRLASEDVPAVGYEITLEPGQVRQVDPVLEIAKRWQQEPGYCPGELRAKGRGFRGN